MARQRGDEDPFRGRAGVGLSFWGKRLRDSELSLGFMDGYLAELMLFTILGVSYRFLGYLMIFVFLVT